MIRRPPSRDTHWITAFLVALVLVLAAPARAQQLFAECDEEGNPSDTLCFGAVQAVPNFNTIAVVLTIVGDDNQNASARIRYRKFTDSAAYTDTGVVMTRIWNEKKFVGKIFWLTENTKYRITLDINDPDNPTYPNLTWTVDATTRATPPTANADTIYWVSPSGSNTNTGRSQGSPFLTIQKALDVMPENKGVTINLLPGTYRENPWLTKNGSSTKYNRLVGYGNRDSIIFEGSDPAWLNLSWTQYSSGGSPTPVWYHQFSTTPNIVDSVGLVVVGADQRLHRATALDSLLTSAFMTTGWFPDPNTNRLYVHLEGDSNPNGRDIHITHGPAFIGSVKIMSKYWLLDNFTIHYTGAGKWVPPAGGDPGYYQIRNFPVWTAPLDGSHWAQEPVIRNLHISTNAECGVYIDNDCVGALVEDCDIDDPRIGTWTYYVSKATLQEICGIRMVGYRGVARNNTVTGLFDGIQTSNGFHPNEDYYGFGTDAHDNRITGVTDDGLEFESNTCVAVAAWNNWVETGNHAISTCPVTRGPVYYLYNVLLPRYGAYKQGWSGPDSSTGTVFYYHNTSTGGSNFISVAPAGSARYTNKHWRNNILVGAGLYRAPVTDYRNSGDSTNCSFDYDLIDANNSTYYWIWDDVPYANIDSVRAHFGWETHGRSVPGGSGVYFADSSNGDYRPVASSLPVDMGGRIDGINTPHFTVGHALYSGYPDAGALDYTAGGGHGPVGPALQRPVRRPFVPTRGTPAETPAPLALKGTLTNPVRAGTNVRFAVSGSFGPAEIEIFDLLGRQRASLALRAGTAIFDWRDTNGRSFEPGVYMIRATDRFGGSPRYSAGHKVTVIR